MSRRSPPGASFVTIGVLTYGFVLAPRVSVILYCLAFRILFMSTVIAKIKSQEKQIVPVVRVKKQTVLANNFTVAQLDEHVRHYDANCNCRVAPGTVFDPRSGEG